MTRYGYIGLGDMGSAMAENLIRNNSDTVTVFDINPQAVETAVSLGAHAVTNPAEVAAASDVLSICVPAAEHISAVLEGTDGICDGAHDGLTILIHSTVLPDTIIDARNLAADWGVQVFDVCVAGGAVQARIGAQTVLVGGLEEIRQKLSVSSIFTLMKSSQRDLLVPELPSRLR